LYQKTLFVYLAVILVLSCKSDSNFSQVGISESNVSIPMPVAIDPREVPQDGTGNAFINISGAKDLKCDNQQDSNTCELSVDSNTGLATTQIQLAAATYSLHLEWRFNDIQFGNWLIAEARKPVTVQTGKTSTLNLNRGDYEPLPDDDKAILDFRHKPSTRPSRSWSATAAPWPRLRPTGRSIFFSRTASK
jgi:hypothetical protein